MNYATLLQAIKDFAVDAEPTFYTHIPEFVKATEKRIINDADLPLAQLAASPTITASVAAVTVPADFLSVDSFAITAYGEKIFLLPKSVDFLDTAYPVATTTDVPKYYAVKNTTTLQLGPPPAAAYATQLRYLGYPASIVDSGTSWLGDNYEAALLYGALRDAAVYLKEEQDVVTMYNNQYNEALGQLKNFGTGRSRIDRYRKR